jgi:D-glycero-alpha-D-manno-heptose-7-phosphate kinase
MAVDLPMTPSRTIHATAPIRICDIGGWTDTWVSGHGRVFNIAVRPLVEVRIDAYPAGSRQARVVLDARNYGLRYAPALDAASWGPHPLLEAAFREIPPPRDVDLEVVIQSDAPAGASTGTSAAVVVALLGALDRLAGGRRSPYALARAAHAVETEHLGRQCGVQDQLSSAHGGLNDIEITSYPHATVTPLVVPDAVLDALDRRLALVYLGRPHRSSDVHEKVVRDLERLGPDCAPLDALRAAATRARDAVLAGDLSALGQVMRDNTATQADLNPALVHADAWRIIEIAAEHDAAGWKVNGAGGDGGSVTLLAGPDPEAPHSMIRRMIEENPALVPLPIAISREGVKVW